MTKKRLFLLSQTVYRMMYDEVILTTGDSETRLAINGMKDFPKVSMSLIPCRSQLTIIMGEDEYVLQGTMLAIRNFYDALSECWDHYYH